MRAQRGQVLVLALGLLLAAATVLYAMFSAGQVGIAKQRLTMAADAAAFGAATWRARVLNYHAYTNRAIIANEVAIAQAVTLSSWSRYFRTLTANAADIASIFPPAYAALRALAEAAEASDEMVQWAARIEVPARGAPAIGYKELLQASQEILHHSAGGFALGSVAAEIARANDRRYFAWVLSDGSAFSRMTKRHASDSDRERLADLVLETLDPFVGGARASDVPDRVPPGCLPLPRLVKRGVTSLTPGLDRWEAVDTVSLHERRSRLFGCREREAIALGWGAAEADADATGGAIVGDRGEIRRNPAALARAEEEMQSQAPYAGISRVRELDYDALADRLFPRSRVTVVARQGGETIGTASARGFASGRVLSVDRFAPAASGPHLWALAVAEVHFRRPPGPHERLEYASLFSPYWQVRLVEPTSEERDAATAHVR